MKAAVLEQLNAPLSIRDLSIPELGIGQVLVRVMASGICGRQIGEITGAKGEDKFLPHLLGHEGGGVVEKTGPGVSKVSEGDHVVLHWRKGRGIESDFPKYQCGDSVIGGGLVTTFNEYAVVSENRLTKIPDDVPYEVAALMGCNVTTALGLVNNEARLRIGQSVAVFGTGGVGLSIVQAASMVSANPIIAVDKYLKKLDFARQFGATHFVNTSEVELREELRKIAGSKGIDVVVECTGNTVLMETAYEITTPGGRIVMVGQPPKGANLTFHSMSNNFSGKTLLDSQGGGTNPTEDIPRYIELYRAGKLEIEKLITARYPLDKINTAVEKMIDGEIDGKCMIIMD